jgi:hypothetical protein
MNRLVDVGQRESSRAGVVGIPGAAQIFAQPPDYQNRRYADGPTPAQLAAAFHEYFKRFARQRAAKRLLVECNSGCKYTFGGWYNMADFASDSGQRIWFDASLRRSEADGWVFAEAPQASRGFTAACS